MTLETKGHIQWLDLLYLRHLIDASMAAYATYSRRQMRLVIELDVIRKAVNLDPRNGVSTGITLPHYFQARATVLDARVTVHACLGGRDGGERGFVHSGVAVVTIQSKISGVELMTIGTGWVGE